MLKFQEDFLKLMENKEKNIEAKKKEINQLGVRQIELEGQIQDYEKAYFANPNEANKTTLRNAKSELKAVNEELDNCFEEEELLSRDTLYPIDFIAANKEIAVFLEEQKAKLEKHHSDIKAKEKELLDSIRSYEKEYREVEMLNSWLYGYEKCMYGFDSDNKEKCFDGDSLHDVLMLRAKLMNDSQVYNHIMGKNRTVSPRIDI